MTDQYQLLKDSQLQVISTYFQTRARWRRLDLRSVVTAILYKLKTGCQWRLLPGDLPCWQSMSYYFYRWRKGGLFDSLNRKANELDRQRAGKEPHPSVLSID